MNRVSRFAILLCFAWLGGCASQQLQQGIEFYKSGQYDRAAALWNPLAQDGNPYAQHNLGLLWEGGLGRTPKSPSQASHWYFQAAKQGYVPSMVRLALIHKQFGNEKAAVGWATLAARWNSSDAMKILQAWSQPIPSPDLYHRHLAAQRARQQQEQKAADDLMTLFAIGIIGAGAAHGVTSNPVPVIPSASGFDSGRGASTVGQCSSDFDCGYGNACVKPPYSSSGVCRRAVDSSGVPTFSGPNPGSIGVRTGQGCISVADCPAGFRCDAALKACVR